jgi:pyruvate formate lyase activating enzyme
VRECADGELVTRSSDRVSRVVPRAVESLGLYHVLPGTRALTLVPAEPHAAAARGVALHTWNVKDLPELARLADCRCVAFSRCEPVFSIETVDAAFGVARDAGLTTVVETALASLPPATELLARRLDAASVTIPTMVEATARRLRSTSPHVLRDNLAALRARGVWVEVTTILEPGVNDSDDELLEIALSLATIDPATPWHVRTAPASQLPLLTRAATSAIERAVEAAARARLQYAYATETCGTDRELTFCHVCRDVVLIERFLGQPRSFLADGGHCPRCRTKARGLFRPKTRSLVVA